MITSVNLSSIPFLSSTDATRASMSAKQILQSLTCDNTEIPYVIGSDYHYLKQNSRMGIIIALDDGKILYSNSELIIVHYENLNKIQDYYIPPVKKTHSIFGTKLRFNLIKDQIFKKGDVLANYDCFLNGVPSYGYNVFTSYMPFFGLNHEDSIVISESFSKKAKAQFIDRVYIPIYEYTLLQKFYNDVQDSFIYFPGIGQKLKDDTLCCLISPKDTLSPTYSDPKMKIQNVLKNMQLSDLLNLQSVDSSKFNIEKIKSKLEGAKISGFKIHRLRKFSEKINMIDTNLQKVLENLYTHYSKFIVDIYSDLSQQFSTNMASTILGKYYMYSDDKFLQNKDIDVKNGCFLLEFELSKEDITHEGDKLANRFANKGVVSLILPDELCPFAVESQKQIDLVFNPFGIFSRMNLGQLSEGIVGKSVMKCSDYIKNNLDDDNCNVAQIITWLNNSVLQYIDPNYAKRIRNEIIEPLINDIEFEKKFKEDITSSNLFVEGPCFAEIDIQNLLKHSVSYKEPVLLKKELIQYMKKKLKVEVPFADEDIYLKDIFCAPIYIQKLYKLSSKLINSRDFGAVKAITKQPVKGRAKGGGSRLGQMELEALLASGCDLAVKELLSVKSDWQSGKDDLLRQLIKEGEYHLPQDREVKSRTKQVVDVQLQFLKE
jgi:DNA-directed RNA polymerase beta subunit